MKKSLLGLLLAVALVVPVFATDKGKSEIDVKVGAIFNPSLTATGNDLISAYAGAMGESIDLNSLNDGVGLGGKIGFSVGAEYYYYVMKDLGIGLGINKTFPIQYFKLTDGGDKVEAKADSTNIFATAKKNFEIKDSFIDSIYVLGRLGFGINNIDCDYVDLSLDNGLYWGLGFGVEKSSFFVEAVYSVNYTKLKVNVSGMELSSDATISAIALNIGYKFVL